MQVTSLLTPFRWYTDFYEQDRYTKDCKICPFQLITDKTRLLPFQIMRDKSPYAVDKFYLRKACINYYEPVLSTNDSLFILDSGTWAKTRFQITNGYAKSTGGTTGEISMSGLTAGKEYSVKIIVNQIYIVSGSSFTAEAYEDTNLLGQIFTPGTYIYTFTASATTFSINYASSNANNYIIIEEVAINEIIQLGTNADDVELDVTSIITCNAGDIDYLTHCGGVLENQLPCGEYYAVIETYDSVYFSEVIFVHDFIPSQSPFVLLEWWNSCDISDVIYKEHTCSYKNRLYIDGPISKAEYPIKEEAEEDGYGNANVVLVKWEKQRTLSVPKAPEFITDSITALRLHDNLYYTAPLRKNQYKVSDAVQFEKSEHALQPVFNECATNVELKMYLSDKVVKTKCCTDIAACECAECEATILEVNSFDDNYDYALILDPVISPSGLYKLNRDTDVWELQDGLTGFLICDDSSEGTGFWEYQPSNPNATEGYIWSPKLISLVHVSGGTFTATGTLISMSYGEIEYSTDGGSNWLIATPRFTPTQLQAGFNVTLSPTPCCGNFLARVHSFDISGCDYGYSSNIEVASPTNDCC